MATCKDCLDYDVCKQIYVVDNKADIEEHCDYFKDQSKFINLPCKVGDTVYSLGYSKGSKVTNVIEENIVKHISIYSFGVFFTVPYHYNFTVDDIGKNFFLTKEEAEKALEERNDSK